MRRGLISWSKAELPECVLDARRGRAQAAMAQAGVDVLAVYTQPARAAGVSWFTGFIPYWNQCILLLPRTGRPTLVAGLSNRVSDWVMRNAHIEAVAPSPNIGAEAGRIVRASNARAVVAIPDLDTVPGGIVAPIGANGVAVIDGTALMERLRAPADAAELALSFKAASIAHAALAEAGGGETDAASLVGTIDGAARRLGAEEVYVALAPDLARDTSLIRLEGTAALAPRFAARVSLAYKGVWVRMVRTLGREGGEESAAALERFATCVAGLPRTEGFDGFSSWLVEGCRATQPLEPLAGSMLKESIAVAPGTVATVQAAMEVGRRPVLIGAPVLVGRDGEGSALLVPPQFDQD